MISPSEPTEAKPIGGDALHVTGPWATDFADAYSRATTEVERAALQDGEISAQEVSDMRGRFVGCLSAEGVSEVSFASDGSFSFQLPTGANPDAVNAQVDECSVSAGEVTIGALASWIERNPQHLDESTIMAACLVRQGVVDKSYSAIEYAEDVPTQDFPFIAAGGDAAFRECNATPLE